MPRRPVTLREIARRTGVHESTVSRALNERTRHLVAEDVAARIAATAHELGYRLNVMASALRTRRSMAVGVIADRLDDPAMAPLLAGIEECLRTAGYVTIVAGTGGDPAQLAATLDGLEGRGADGIILLGDSAGDLCPEVPLVSPADIRGAGPDADEAGIGLAVAHLVRRGHRAIGHLAGPSSNPAARARMAGFRTAMTAAGLFVTAIEICAGFSIEAGRRGADMQLARRPHLTALVAADDRLALGALEALAALGRRCPVDVSVTGFGDLPLVDRVTPPLTSVHIDRQAAGRIIAELLLARIADPAAAPPAAGLTAELRERGSTATARPRG